MPTRSRPRRSPGAQPHSLIRFALLSFLLSALAASSACTRLLKSLSERELRESLLRAVSNEFADNPRRDLTLQRPPSELRDRFTSERLEELESMAGPSVYSNRGVDLGEDLTGLPFRFVRVSLREAIDSAVIHNLDVQVASITPSISESQVVAAEARFDSTFFTSIDWSKTDEQDVAARIGGFPIGTSLNESESSDFTTGIRKNLITGGRLELSTSVNRQVNTSPGRRITPDPAYTAAIDIAISQPMLRGFGTEANLSQIRISRNAHRDAIQRFRTTLLDAVNQTESAYWNLAAAQKSLLIRERLLEQGIRTRDRMMGRVGYDVKPSEISDVISRVASRKVLVRRARNDVAVATDRLKRLMNAPGLSVGSELMVIPTDDFMEQPVTVNYVDAIQTSLRCRPEVSQAILTIDDSSIRQMLAENLRLPRLDLSARIRYTGLDNETFPAYDELGYGNFIDYVLSGVLEFPIGNREAQANYRRARSQRLQAVIAYRQIVQGVVNQVKDALRGTALNYELLTQTQDARLAATESLRTIEVEEELKEASTPEFLNLKLSRQESLAGAELEEVRALVDYQISLANLYFAMGVALERNHIEFNVPDFADLDQ